jgi:hypothetical protein
VRPLKTKKDWKQKNFGAALSVAHTATEESSIESGSNPAAEAKHTGPPCLYQEELRELTYSQSSPRNVFKQSLLLQCCVGSRRQP